MSGHGGVRPGSGQKSSARGRRPQINVSAWPEEHEAAVTALNEQVALGTIGELVRELAAGTVKVRRVEPD